MRTGTRVVTVLPIIIPAANPSNLGIPQGASGTVISGDPVQPVVAFDARRAGLTVGGHVLTVSVNDLREAGQ